MTITDVLKLLTQEFVYKFPLKEVEIKPGVESGWFKMTKVRWDALTDRLEFYCPTLDKWVNDSRTASDCMYSVAELLGLRIKMDFNYEIFKND